MDGHSCAALETVILTSSVLYELIGPGCAKLSLYLSHSYSDRLEEIVPADETGPDGKKKTAAELLIERIQTIQRELPPRDAPSAEEEAFLEAAEEQLAARRDALRGFWNRRFR